jgi:23S rRNA (uracil1939-C5)-methyltransferase
VIEPGREYSAEISDIALPSSHGVARLNDLVVFVPGAVPGDRVRLRVVRLHKSFAYGELVTIEEESPMRERPRCPVFGRCGGCDLQALSYEAQLRVKENHLVQVLRRVGGQDLEEVAVASIVPSVDTFFYRGKVEFSFGEADGRATPGLSERPSPLRPSKGRVVPVEGCFLFSPAAAEVLPVVHEWLRRTGLTAYNPLTGKGTLKRLVLREAKGTGEIMCHLVAASDISRSLGDLGEVLPRTVAQLKSFYVTGTATRLLWGEPAIDEFLGGLRFRIYPLSFFQPNPKTAGKLYERLVAVAGLTGGEQVVGLYCGAGTIELFLSRHAKGVTGIDSSKENIAAAQENAGLNKLQNCLFLKDKAEKAARRFKARKVDLLVIDPPRKGLTDEAVAAVREIGAERLAYISCNPSTLARDLLSLKEVYKARQVIPFDFFPHTSHFEVLTLLERK